MSGTAFINGRIYFLNGQIAPLNMGAGMVPNGDNIPEFKVDIINGSVRLEFDSETEQKGLFWLYNISYDILDNFILSEEIRLGRGLIFFPESIEDSTAKRSFDWDIFPFTNTGEGISQKEFINVLASNVQFRYGVKDFHTGLIDIKNCPAHFYRAIECFRRAVVTQKLNNRKREWEDFKNKIQITEEEDEKLQKLTELAEEYRHGNHTTLIDNYVDVLSLTKDITLKTYNYLKTNNKVIQEV